MCKLRSERRRGEGRVTHMKETADTKAHSRGVVGLSPWEHPEQGEMKSGRQWG